MRSASIRPYVCQPSYTSQRAQRQADGRPVYEKSRQRRCKDPTGRADACNLGSIIVSWFPDCCFKGLCGSYVWFSGSGVRALKRD